MVRDPLPVVLWSEIDRMVGAEGVNCLTLALPIDRQLRSIEGEGWSDAPKPILVLRIVSLGVLAYIVIFVVVSFLWR